MKKFISFSLLIGLLALHSCSSDDVDEEKVFKPTIVDLQTSNIASSSTKLSATVSDDGGSSVNKRGFRLSKIFTDMPTDDWGTDYSCGDGVGKFSKTIENLEENTTYYYIAYASNMKGCTYSTVLSFTTLKETFKPTISSLHNSDISSSSVRLSATVSDDGGTIVGKRGFRLSKSSTDMPTDGWGTDYSCGEGLGEFSMTVEDLEENTTYYYVAYASNINGCTYSTVLSFTTLKETFKPTISNLQASDISSSSVKLNATVSDNGGIPVNSRGFRLSKNLITTPDNNWGTNYSCGEGDGDFDVIIDGLEEKTTYYYAAYASNDKGYSFTDVLSFTTLEHTKPAVVPVVLLKPTITAIEHSSSGFIATDGTKYSYKFSFAVTIDVTGYEDIEQAGYKIGGGKWWFNNLSHDGTYTENMQQLSNSSTLTETITAYAKMKDGSEYTGNQETISATYNGGGGGSEVTSKMFPVSKVRVELNPSDYLEISFNNMASHLRIYGITIYKSGSGYYWKDMDGRKHSVLPDRTYKDVVYWSDYALINGKVNTAYLYVTFSFTSF